MTTATAEGRQLVIGVQGVDDPFRVDPLPARRGKQLTQQFLTIALAGPTAAADFDGVGEQIFIEALGPVNYSRMSGLIVELVDDDGNVIATWNGSADSNPDPSLIYRKGGTLRGRDPRDDEELWGETIRQEEAEAICLAAFYWQTVAGTEAVNAFLDAGEGTAGSVKALGLLLSRTGLSTLANSSVSGSVSSIQQAGSTETPSTGKPSALVLLPANKVSKRPKQAKRK